MSRYIYQVKKQSYCMKCQCDCVCVTGVHFNVLCQSNVIGVSIVWKQCTFIACNLWCIKVCKTSVLRDGGDVGQQTSSCEGVEEGFQACEYDGHLLQTS